MSARRGDGRRVIDRPLIDELLDRRLDSGRVLHVFDSSWGRYGIQSGSLRRVRENLGVASDPLLAARVGFQLGIELPAPTAFLGETERGTEKRGSARLGDESTPGSRPDYQIALLTGRLFNGGRVTTRVDEVQCAVKHGLSVEAADTVCDACGRYLNSEVPAGTAFELAIEARAAVEAWGMAP